MATPEEKNVVQEPELTEKELDSVNGGIGEIVITKPTESTSPK